MTASSVSDTNTLFLFFRIASANCSFANYLKENFLKKWKTANPY